MRVRWTYELPRRGEDELSDGGAAPLHWDGEAVVVPVRAFAHTREVRAQQPALRGYRFELHRVGDDGRATWSTFETEQALIAQHWSFVRWGEDVLFHVGSFHSLHQAGAKVAVLPEVDAGMGVGRGVFVHHGHDLLFADRRTSAVHCFDTRTSSRRWSRELPSGRYGIGPLSLCHDELVCFGDDSLHQLDLADGSTRRTTRYPRADKLFPALAFEGHSLFAYTNWTSGGLLCVDSARGEVKWRYAKRGGTVNLQSNQLCVAGRTAVLPVNDGSSLVGVDLDSGEARWSFAARWLYTPIAVDGGSVIFGTAGGRKGALRRHDATSGETEWAVEMEGGCPYYAERGEQLVAGDWGGMLRCINRSDGVVTDELEVGGHIMSAPLLTDSTIFVLRWPSGPGFPSLLAVDR